MRVTNTTGAGLYGDGLSGNLYVDWEINNVDPCVAGDVGNNGSTVIYTDRRMPDGSICNASGSLGTAARYVIVKFPFGDADPGDGLPGPCALYGLPDDGNGYCTVRTNEQDQQRIILSSLFGAKDKTTAIEVGIRPDPDQSPSPVNLSTYSLQTDAQATIVRDSNANIRTAVYSGTARLYPIVNGAPSSTPGTSPFQFSAQIKVQNCVNNVCAPM
jgi:hypothetical protein